MQQRTQAASIERALRFTSFFVSMRRYLIQSPMLVTFKHKICVSEIICDSKKCRSTPYSFNCCTIANKMFKLKARFYRLFIIFEKLNTFHSLANWTRVF